MIAADSGFNVGENFAHHLTVGSFFRELPFLDFNN